VHTRRALRDLLLTVLAGCLVLIASCDWFTPGVPEPPDAATVSLVDPVGDLYGQGGVPATGPEWQDITGLEGVRDEKTATFTLSCDDVVPQPSADSAVLLLIDIDGAIRFVAAIRTGIMGVPIEDRVPNEGIATLEGP